MNEILKNIKERRSIRSFKSEMPSKDLIDSIIEAGLYAPSGMNRQETIIVAITDREVRGKLSKMNASIMGGDSDPFYGAPVILVVLAKKSDPYRVYNGSVVMENMLLASHSLGLGSIWIHRAKEEFETREGKEILKSLGLGDDWEGIGNCAIGFVNGEYPTTKERKEGRVYYI